MVTKNCYQYFLLSTLLTTSLSFQLSHQNCRIRSYSESRCKTYLSVVEPKKQSRSTESDAEIGSRLDQEETPAGVVGAEFFGGNSVKTELYDADAEEKAGAVAAPEDMFYDRFQDSATFPDEVGRLVAQSLQEQINSILYEEENMPSDPLYKYSSNMIWETPMDANKASRTPLTEIKSALDFYNRVDIAVVAGESVSPNSVNIKWEISLVWPNFWEARVLLTGSSLLTLDETNKSIIKQIDSLDEGNDILSAVSRQVTPRFWDTYHIGMTPSAERTPCMKPSNSKRGLFSNYMLYEIPSRLVLKPTMVDVGTRDDRYAQVIPNHAFSAFIKTMGPKRQRYVTASPVEVQISRVSSPGGSSGSQPLITWTIPLSVELQTNSRLPLPGDDPEAPEGSSPDCCYEYQSRRLVATLPYGGGAQDVEVADVRKRLYEQVQKDGHKPKLDENGRPKFFFVQHDVKACYTEGGLGMAVYDWRPKFVNSNEIGIELDLNT